MTVLPNLLPDNTIHELVADKRKWRLWVRKGVATEPLSLQRLLVASHEPWPRGVVIERFTDLPTSKESL